MKDEIIQRNNYESAFPKGVHFTPVPSPLLGPMLKQVSSYNELVCLLRFLNLIHLRKESPKWIEQNMLVSDDVLQSVIGSAEDILDAIEKCIKNRIILRAAVGTIKGNKVLVLNTYDAKSNLDRITESIGHDESALEVVDNATSTENIFSLYENNIGSINPLITEELKYAKERYPDGWIHDAFREAVINNARSWRYVQSILENWHANGRMQGATPERSKSGRNRRHIKEVGQNPNKRY